MPNESQSDPFNWRNKLEALDNLPVEPLDKTAAWAKLNERLRQRRAHKKDAWYWAAAACLLVAFLATWQIRIHKEIPLVKNSTPSKPVSPVIVHLPTEDSMIAVSPSIHPAGKLFAAAKVKGKKKEYLVTNRIAFDDSVLNSAAIVKKPEPTFIPSNEPDIIAVAAVMPEKKRLRVVHINELDKPMEQAVQFAQNNAVRRSKTEPVMYESFTRISFSTNSSDNILKINLSPSN